MNQVHRHILIMAGGTGGHVFPALSIARSLQQQGALVSWLGTQAGLEARVIPPTEIPFHTISIGGLRGKSLLRKLFGPVRIVQAIWQSVRLMRRLQPDCVLGMGGFVTGPGGIAAWLLRKPLVIHEQNAIAGFTNLMLLPFSTVAMEAFPGAIAHKRSIASALVKALLPGKHRIPDVVGNPVRQEICDLPEPVQPETDTRRRVLVVGGSLGAQALNEVLPQVLAAMTEDERPAVYHQCGEKHLADTLNAYRVAGLEVNNAVEEGIIVAAFIDNMASAYAWADLVVCRSGALTVAELAAAGVASVLVPYPHAVDDHQTENARFLAERGAARIVPSASLGISTLLPVLRELLSSPALLFDMARKARALGKPDADVIAAGHCLEVCHG